VEQTEREAWLSERGTGIGGSEAPVLYGIHPWVSEYQLWAEKTGRVKRTDPTPQEAPLLFWGNQLESAVRDGYSKITGRTVVAGVRMARHPEAHCMLANTDGLIVGVDAIEGLDNPGTGVYEGKTANVYKSREWDAGIPDFYQVQVQHYLEVLDLEWGALAVFMGGDRKPLRTFDVIRSREFGAHLRAKVTDWWDRHVLADIPPEADGSEQTAKVLRMVSPVAQRRTVDLGPELVTAYRRLAEIGDTMRDLKAEERSLKNKVMAALGEADVGVLPDGSGWTFENVHSRGYTKVVEPSSNRVLKRATPQQISKKRDQS
jgi:putative phage-type endonuclease